MAPGAFIAAGSQLALRKGPIGRRPDRCGRGSAITGCLMPDSRSANAAGELFARRVAADAPPNELGWVRDLYDVASLPDSWQRFLACVCDLMDASVAAIAIRGAGQDGNRLRAIYVRGHSD